ncbi:MAG: hypothetical protein ABF857_13050, partial [Lacticaseibacillus paracasei]
LDHYQEFVIIVALDLKIEVFKAVFAPMSSGRTLGTSSMAPTPKLSKTMTPYLPMLLHPFW